ncbi:MAG: carbohydrate kinase family protein [Clostridia bacterium]|nr:carbohydrate kinase family protein [Clostridia bacterium]MBQ8268208.1 carbohydrate kinase family protein [Clostridia bacterium]
MAGIAIAGSILVDKINEIGSYPSVGELTQIRAVKRAVGGCVPNVAIDLKTLSPETDIYAIGKVGQDDEKTFLLHELGDRGIDLTGIRVSRKERTSFTEVMSIVGGQRTFFTYPGASADFGLSDIDFHSFKADMLHLGYFLLLDKVDNGDGEKILAKAKSLGIKTSIDLVSENSDRYKLVIPCLKYTDNVIINESEAGKIAEIEPKRENLKAICEKIMGFGIGERVIIHMPALAVCLAKDGSYTEIPSYKLPAGFIKGTTGAGDAFCAGALLAIYLGKSDEQILSIASRAAVGALSAADAVSGMKSLSELEALCASMPFQSI